MLTDMISNGNDTNLVMIRLSDQHQPANVEPAKNGRTWKNMEEHHVGMALTKDSGGIWWL